MSVADLTLLTTAIGSLPHTDPLEAVQVMREETDIPAWPQLPRRDFKENMYVQYSQGFPGVVVDSAQERVWVDRSQDLNLGLEQLYAAYLENDLDFVAISQDYAAGLHAFLSSNTPGESDLMVKGQVTGPISWGLTVTDEKRRPILYDEALADAVAKHLRLKAAWQERELGKVASQTIIFVDEPYMSAYGSAFFSLDRDLVVSLLTETMSGIQGLVGVHCCGNTDWSILMETPARILSFDAYNYAHTLALYPQAIQNFLQRGGILAWGIVPADDEAAVWRETVDSLTERLLAGMSLLVQKGILLDDLLAACLITPSCGLRGYTEAGAVRALRLAKGVAAALRKRSG